MAKFEMEMEIKGFRLKLRGERAELPMIQENIKRQIAGLIEPAANIAQGYRGPVEADGTVNPSFEPAGRSKRARKPRRPAGNGSGDAGLPPVDFTHDPGAWGTPRQGWKAGEKVLWLLHVMAKQNAANDLAAGSIAETFNKHFRQAGPLKRTSMSSILGGMKQKSPALIGDNANNSPITWFLTEEGHRSAAQLVAQAKGEA